MNKYYKNFILCGDVDYHCLLCVETFETTDDVEKHIRWEKHRKILKMQSYFPKFRKDYIYKIGNQFYCEICNIIAPDVSGVTAHIKGEPHVANKTKPVEKEKINCMRDSGFIIVSDVILTKEEWNAIVDQRCLICDVHVTGISALDKHVKTTEHVVKLIQAKIVKENDVKIYRKINPNLVYCLICKKTVSTETLSRHWEDKDHIQSKELSISRTSKDSGAVKSKQNENMKKIMEIQKVLYDIDVKGGKATCKLCDKVVKFHFSEMIAHQEEHKALDTEDAIYSDDEVVKFSEVTDHGKRRAELKQYGKKHNIKLNEGGSKGYCYICHIHLSAHIHVFRQHVRGWQHKGLLEVKGIKKETNREQPIYKTKPLKKYLESVFHSITHQVLWLNSEFSVDNFSFLLVAPVNDVACPKKIICHACQIEYNVEDNETHLKTAQHKANFVNAEVVDFSGVRILVGEFIREVAPNLYHCGFCNRQIAYYDNILRHFRIWSHKSNRMSKHMTSPISEEILNDSPLSILSTNPDVMYLQLMKQFAFRCLLSA